MLVLSRGKDSAIQIGPDITVKVLSIQRQRVQLGIEAPKDVRVLRDELVAEYEEPATKRPPAGDKRSSGMKLVLVIEDDPVHAKLIRRALCKYQGTMVTVAETAKIGLHALGAWLEDVPDVVRPDLIVLDMGLPDGSGLDVLHRIRSVHELAITPVVMLSCCDSESVVQQCLESGANAFVVKSPNYDEFQTSVSRIGEFWTGDCFAPPYTGSQPSFPAMTV